MKDLREVLYVKPSFPGVSRHIGPLAESGPLAKQRSGQGTALRFCQYYSTPALRIIGHTGPWVILGPGPGATPGPTAGGCPVGGRAGEWRNRSKELTTPHLEDPEFGNP